MKRIFLVLILLLSFCTLSGCKYNVSKNKQVTKEEAEEFIKDMKNPFYESKTSFQFTQIEKYSEISKEEKSVRGIKYDIYGSLNEDLNGEVHYEVKNSSKEVETSLKGKDVYKDKFSETGDIFLREESDDNKYYFTIDIDTKIPDGKIKQNLLRTTLREDSVYFNSVNNILLNVINTLSVSKLNDGEDYDIILPTATFYYISGNKLRIVNSTENSHLERVYVFENGVLSSYKYIKKTVDNYSESYIEKELSVKDSKDVKIPNDAEDYKTEYQKYEPKFFDNISLSLILIILAIILVVATLAVVVVRIIKRPKFVE